MRSSWSNASHLLSVDSRKGTQGFGRIRAHPAVMAFLNLFFCGYMDQFIRNDSGGHYLGILLTVECSAIVLVAVGSFISTGNEILLKSAIFPTTSLSRLLFVFISSIRRPATLAVWLTTAIFMVVSFRHSPLIVAVALTCFLLLLMLCEIVVSALCVKLARSSEPVVGLGVVSVVFIICLLSGPLVFHMTSLLASMPLIGWTVSAISAAQAGNTDDALMNVLFLFATLLVAIVAGRKFS